MINCKACFHRSHNTTQWMMRSLQERIHDMKGPFVLSWSYQYGKQIWYQHIFWKRGYCVARNLRQIAKVAKTLPSNLWPRLHTIAKTFSRLRVGEQNWKEFFFLLTPFMCKGEDLDDSNTLGTGRVFYLKAKKIRGRVWGLWIQVYEFSQYFVLQDQPLVPRLSSVIKEWWRQGHFKYESMLLITFSRSFKIGSNTWR